MNRFAQKRQVRALEQTISIFMRLYDKHPDQLFFRLCAFSDDSRWVLRYLAGREMGRLIPEKADQAVEVWFKLADDENLYVREGTAKGITFAAEKNFDAVWNSWEKAFSHSSENVRQTAAMTFIKLLKKQKERRELLGVLEQIKNDSSVKVKSIYENYISPHLVQDDAPSNRVEDFTTTEALPVPARLIDQVVGQDHAIEIIKLAARQYRSVLLIGEPGTGKSMLGQAMAELLPASTLEDIIVEAGEKGRNVPKIRRLPAGAAETYIRQHEKEAQASVASFRWVIRFAYLVSLFVTFFYYITRNDPVYLMAGVIVVGLLYWFSKSMKDKPVNEIPKYLVNNSNKKQAPFLDATGLHAGALLGDVRHDPYQSGGLEVMPHHLVEPGAIHLAHQGVLFIDEVSTLSIESQQALLTAFQEKKLAITGRSPGSSGAMIRTEPVPSDFIMVIAGNFPDVEKIHPALRSRIRGYGYEVYTKTSMTDTADNRYKLALFVAQEIRRDGKIPHFTREAVEVVIERAKEMSPHRQQLTTRFRELGGLIRSAGDIAILSSSPLVEREHVQQALRVSRSLEEQIFEEHSVGKTSTFEPCSGVVHALCISEVIGHIVQVSSAVQPFDNVELKLAEAWLKNGDELIIEAALNRLQLYGRYYIQIEGAGRGETLDEVSLAVMVAAILAKKHIVLPDAVAVCGRVNIKGVVSETTYFEKKIKAAKRLGIRKIVAPTANRTNDIPADIEFIWVNTLDEVYHAIQLIQ